MFDIISRSGLSYFATNDTKGICFFPFLLLMLESGSPCSLLILFPFPVCLFLLFGSQILLENIGGRIGDSFLRIDLYFDE